MTGVLEDVDPGSREHYEDAALYDYEYRRRTEDIAMYRTIAKDHFEGPGRILEFGCGSGRVTIPLLRDGHEVTALDGSAPMLARLRARTNRALAERLTTIEGDLRSFRVPGRKFSLVIAAFNVVEHLYTRGEFAAVFDCVRTHLTDDGIFVFDVQNPDLKWLLRDPGRRYARTKFTDPTTKRAIVYSTNHVYDPITQIAIIRLFYEPADGKGPTQVIRLSQRKFFPAELEALVSHAGFRVLDRFGDFFFEPLAADHLTQVLICQPTPKPRRKTPKKH